VGGEGESSSRWEKKGKINRLLHYSGEAMEGEKEGTIHDS